MDKNKFWLGRRLFNTASPRLGALTQRKARPQDGCPNATQGMSASWAPQRNARHVRKLGTPTHVRNANTRHACKSASWAPQRSAKHVRKLGAPTQGTSASWVPQRNPRHVRKLGAPMHIRNANARHVRNARHVCTFASWAQQCNTRHVRKLGAPMQRKARLQVERPNATQGTSASWAPQRTSTTQTQGTSTHPQVGRENETQGTSARWSPKRKTHPQRKRPHKGALG
jgi:hypothetical protein